MSRLSPCVEAPGRDTLFAVVLSSVIARSVRFRGDLSGSPCRSSERGNFSQLRRATESGALRRQHEADRRAVVLGQRPELPPGPEPTPLVAFRAGGRIHFEVLEPDAFTLLDAIARGEALGRACEAIAAEKSTEDVARLQSALGGWFRSWASWGLFVDVVRGAT